MQLKWMEDLLALAETGSFSRAAEARHVTHPAFGRRIQALEAWAGLPLVERGRSPATLTPAGALLRDKALQLVRGVSDARLELLDAAGREADTVRIATGRTLARTALAHWLGRSRPLLAQARVHVTTRALSDTVRMLERDEVHFMLAYHHPALTIRLDGRQFTQVPLASDRLVPVSRADASGAPRHALRAAARGKPLPLLAYGGDLALRRVQDDLLASHPDLPPLAVCIECDSPDALFEYALKGLGVAWLPWSLAQAECKAGRLALAGDRRFAVPFDVRLHRAKRTLGPTAEAFWRAALD